MNVGDWNTDFGCACDLTSAVSSFGDDRSLVVVDLAYKEWVGFTFLHDRGRWSSFMD